MTIAAQALIQPKYASASLNNDYAAQAKTIVDAFTATNTSAGAASITVHVVPANGSPNAGNRVVQARIIAVGESYTVTPMLGHVIESGSSIWCVATASNSVVLFASGRVIT